MQIFRLIFFFLFLNFALAQEEKVEFFVYDKEDGMSIPGAVFYLENQNIGSTNEKGILEKKLIEIKGKKLKIIFPTYQEKSWTVKTSLVQKIPLKPTVNEIRSVTIAQEKTENPAHRLLRGIVKNRPKYHFEKTNRYSYDQYFKMSVGLGNLPKNITKKGLLKPFDFVFEYADTIDGIVYVPGLLLEEKSTEYIQKTPYKKKKTVQQQQKSMFRNVNLEDYLSDLNGHFDFQADFVLMAGKNFISPFSSAGINHYHYRLMDSSQEQTKKYQVDFLPKNEADLTFSGSFWVEEGSFFVDKLEGKLNYNSNINYVSSFSFLLEYQKINEEVFVPSLEKMEVLFHVIPDYLGKKIEKTLAIRGNKTSVFTNYQWDIPLWDEKNPPDSILPLQDRPLALEPKEVKIYEMTQRIEATHRYRQIQRGFYFLTEGFWRTGHVEWGYLWGIYSRNGVEDHRFTLELQSNRFLHKDFYFRAYGAYGLGDRAFKYGGEFQWFLNKKKWEFLHFSAASDLEGAAIRTRRNLHFVNAMYSYVGLNDVLANFLIRKGLLPRFDWVLAQRFGLVYGREFFPGFNLSLGTERTVFSPVGQMRWKNIGQENEFTKNIAFWNVHLSAHYLHQPIYVQRDYFRLLMKKFWYPLLSLQLEIGIPYLLGQVSYQKLELHYEQYFFVGPFGESRLRMSGGKVFGRVPYLAFFVPLGNNSYIFNYEGMNTMNRSEFLTDHYFYLQYEHNFMGFFLGKIPGIKKLKWREVVGLRLLTGGLKYFYGFVPNQNFYFFKNYKPLLEFNVGLDNIFQFFRIDVLMRASYLQHPKIEKVGVRGSLQFNF